MKNLLDRKPIDGWIQTASGQQFYLLRPEPLKIRIEDIAAALSRVCRFGGHCRDFYSVAQHCVLVSRLCPTQPAEGLLHDAAEAYMGDIVRPLKNELASVLKPIERRIEVAIAERFGLRAADFRSDEVHHADDTILATEKRDLMVAEPWPWHPLPEAIAPRIVAMPPMVAYHLFIDRVRELSIF